MSLSMSLSKVFNIYSGRIQCVNPAGVTLNAGLDITAEVRLEMGSRYAYYFSTPWYLQRSSIPSFSWELSQVYTQV
jgi:hypothetical protein